MGNLHIACYRLIPGDRVPSHYQLPNFAYYSYWYMMILLDAYSMLRRLVHGYRTRNE